MEKQYFRLRRMNILAARGLMGSLPIFALLTFFDLPAIQPTFTLIAISMAVMVWSDRKKQRLYKTLCKEHNKIFLNLNI